jgi:hypothetical protein
VIQRLANQHPIEAMEISAVSFSTSSSGFYHAGILTNQTRRDGDFVLKLPAFVGHHSRSSRSRSSRE